MAKWDEWFACAGQVQYASHGSMMMIEGKVRDQFTLSKTHTGATQRTNMIDSSSLITHATSNIVAIVRSLLELLLVSYMPLAPRD